MYYKKYFRTRFSMSAEQKREIENVKNRLYEQEDDKNSEKELKEYKEQLSKKQGGGYKMMEANK